MILVEATTQRVPARSDRTRWIALFVVCLGQLMIVLDTTIVIKAEVDEGAPVGIEVEAAEPQAA